MHVIAPSWLVARERFAAGAAVLEAWGYDVVFDEATLFEGGRGSVPARTEALNAAIADPEAQVVWAARGGYGATRTLDGVDLAPLAVHPKWLVGFSDVTALHAAWHRAGWGTLHGPVVSNLHRWTDDARAELRAWLEGGTTGTLPGRHLAGPAEASGVLLGGNLSLLASLVGTPWTPDVAGAILLLEDLDEKPYRLDRYLTQLRQAGALDGVRGFVLGQWTRCGDDPPAVAATLLERLGDLGVPVLGEVPVGHERSSRAVPLGAHARIEGDRRGPGRLVLVRAASA